MKQILTPQNTGYFGFLQKGCHCRICHSEGWSVTICLTEKQGYTSRTSVGNPTIHPSPQSKTLQFTVPSQAEKCQNISFCARKLIKFSVFRVVLQFWRIFGPIADLLLSNERFDAKILILNFWVDIWDLINVWIQQYVRPKWPWNAILVYFLNNHLVKFFKYFQIFLIPHFWHRYWHFASRNLKTLLLKLILLNQKFWNRPSLERVGPPLHLVLGRSKGMDGVICITGQSHDLTSFWAVGKI